MVDAEADSVGHQTGEGESNIPETNTFLSTEASTICDKAVADYRQGTLSKVAALIKIQNAIAGNAGDGDTSAVVKALGSYLAILDNFDHFRNAALGRPVEGDDGPGSEDGGQHRGGGDDGDSLDSSSSSGSYQPTTRKRARSVEEDGDDEHQSGRRRINTGAFPWVIEEDVMPAQLSTELRQTLSILENFSRDIKVSKSSLLNSARCPQFPDSEWTNMLSGRVIDFDHVLSGVYSAAPDEHRREQLGSIEVVVGNSTPVRVVKTHSHWVIAYEQYVEATLYVFPHRRNELLIYGKFIRQLFTSFPPELHGRVIQFDKAVRLRVAQRRDLLLSDHIQFTDLNLLWLQNAGGVVAGVDDRSRHTGGTSTGGGGKQGRRDACRRWNDGRCPNSVSDCKYAHICSKCRNTGHVSKDCGSNSARK